MVRLRFKQKRTSSVRSASFITTFSNSATCYNYTHIDPLLAFAHLRAYFALKITTSREGRLVDILVFRSLFSDQNVLILCDHCLVISLGHSFIFITKEIKNSLA